MVRNFASRGALAAAALLFAGSLAVRPSAIAQADPDRASAPADIIGAGESRTLPQYATFRNPSGTLGVLNTDGPINTRDHPFFQPVGTNGRACVTCHQPADAMSLSTRTINRIWAAKGAQESLFASIDGADCPTKPIKDRASHSLLLKKGLFRVALPWPPKDPEGQTISPEFDITVVSDPTGCNSDAVFGLQSQDPHISVFRRPRMAANIKYVEPDTPLSLWHIRTGEVRPIDPVTGHRLGGNIMSDSRASTVMLQMVDAFHTHMQGKNLRPAQQAEIRRFLFQIYAAQTADRDGGALNEGGAGLGPEALRDGKPAVVGAYSARPMFPEIEGWVTQRLVSSLEWTPLVRLPAFRASRPGEATETPQQRAYRDSVARGYLSFQYRQFLIRNVADLNGFIGNPVKQTCAGCHNMVQTGMDVAPGYLDLGTTTYPTATPAPDLPLFRIDCHADARPHPYLGRQIYTTDPGRALVTGRCADVGKVVVQQMRGLAARAPYFAGGSAPDLKAVAEFYDRRFHIGYSKQDITDLVNFMGAL